MYIIAEPVTEEQVQQIQSRNKSKIEEFERSILGLHKDAEDDAPSAKSAEEDTSDWKDIHAQVEEELTKDEMLSESTSTQSSEPAITDITSDYGGPKGPPDAAPSESGTMLAQSPVEEGFEHSAAATVDDLDDQVDDEEEDNGDEDNKDDEDVVKEKDGKEGQEDGKTADARESKEDSTSGTIEEEGLVHDSSEGDPGQNTVEELAAGETSSTEDISEVPNSDGEQGVSGVAQDGSPNTTGSQGDDAKNGKKQTDNKDVPSSPLLAMTLTIRNKVNDKYVFQPENLARSDKWTVEYALAEISSASRAWSLYGACQMRRKKKLDDDDVTAEDVAKNYYLRRIRELSEQGRRWRKQQDRIERKTGKVVLDQPSPSTQSHANVSPE